MINHSLHTYKCSFIYFLLLYDTIVSQSHRQSLCSVMSHVVLFAYLIKLNISTRELQKLYQGSDTVNLSAFCNAVEKLLDKISSPR